MKQTQTQTKSIAPRMTRVKPVAATVTPFKRQCVTRYSKPANMLGIVDQITLAFSKSNRLATTFGLVLGAVVPCFVFELVHFEVGTNPWLWLLVVGGLLYSALTVYDWGCSAFGSKYKAIGFVLLLEGAMTFSGSHYLQGSALAILAGINAVKTACNLIADKKAARV